MSMYDWLLAEFGFVNETCPTDHRVDCPFCKDADNKQHLYISISSNAAHCFRCNWSGSHFKLVKAVTGAETNAEVWAILKEPGLKIEDYQTVVEQLVAMKSVLNKPRTITDMPDWYRPFRAYSGKVRYVVPVYRYARSRLSDENIAYHGIGYCAKPGHRNQFRMVIPIEDGYFQARSLERKPARKYINPKFPVDYRLFNPQALYNKEALIGEGAISAIALGKNAVATLGNNGATEAQKERLAASDVERFGIGYDAGEEYSPAVIGLAEYLSKQDKTVFIRKFAEGDPDTCDVYEDETFDYRGRSWFSMQLMSMELGASTPTLRKP